MQLRCDLPLRAYYTGSETQRSGRHLPERRAEISMCLMGRVRVGSAVCGLLRRDLLGFVSSVEQRERGLCLSSPGDTTLNKAVHAGILRKTQGRALLRASGAGKTHVHKSLYI